MAPANARLARPGAIPLRRSYAVNLMGDTTGAADEDVDGDYSFCRR